MTYFFGTPIKYASLVTGVNLTGQADDTDNAVMAFLLFPENSGT